MSDRAMAEGAMPYIVTVRARRDVPQERHCLDGEALTRLIRAVEAA